MLFVPQTVCASQFSFSQSPQIHDVIAKPGSTVVLPFTLTNAGDPSVMKLQVYTLAIKDSVGSYELTPYYSDNPVRIQFNLNNSPYSIDESFFMNTSEAIGYEIAVYIPEGMPEGDYYFAVVGETEQNEGFVNTSNIFLQGGVGSLVYLTISSNGSLDQSGTITQFDVQSNKKITWMGKTYRIFDSFAAIPFVLNVANTGANHFQAEGTISVRPRIFGSNSHLVSIHPTYLLSDTSKGIISTQSRSRENTAVLQAPFIGVYSAQAVVKVGVAETTLMSDLTYIVFPYTYVGVTIGMIFLVAVGLVFVKRMGD